MTTNGIFTTIINTLYDLGMNEPSLSKLKNQFESKKEDVVETVSAVVSVCLASGNSIDIQDVISITKVTCENNKHLHIIICELRKEFTDMVKKEVNTGINNFVATGRIEIMGDMYTILFTEVLSNVRKDNNCDYFRSLITTMLTEYHQFLENTVAPFVANYIIDENDDITLSSVDYGLFYAPLMLCKQMGMNIENDRVSGTKEGKLFIKYVSETGLAQETNKFAWTGLFDSSRFCGLLSVEEYDQLVFNAFDDDEDNEEYDDYEQ